ncbi:MAG: outer membrane lipoprotein carrier protein LolA [Bacteroidetes bacterium]|nr:outer membrane lipoprotein carrier protein LolA [Bacteroidota bacterium]
MKIRSLLTGILMFSVLSSSWCQGNYAEMKNPALFREKFTASAQKINTIEAGFIQEKNMSVLSEKIITKGHFLFRKENMLRWEYTDPFRYLIILNNGKILIRDDEKQNTLDVRNNKMFAEINAIIIGSVQGNLFNDEKKFSTSFFEAKSSYLVKLKPLTPNMKEFLKEIWIFFDAVDISVARLEMHEPSGDYTKIDFTGKKINAVIPDEKFLIP